MCHGLKTSSAQLLLEQVRQLSESVSLEEWHAIDYSMHVH